MDQGDAGDLAVRGRWTFAGGRVEPRGGVLVRRGKVAAVLRAADPDPPGAQVIDLPRALVHAGLLDAHAHLDLSGLAGAIPPGRPFVEWIGRVRDLRAAAGPAALEAAAAGGLRDLAASGATAVIDFSYGGLSEGPIRASGLRAAVLREVIGPGPERAAEALAAAREWLESREPTPLVSFGLAPHSPYLAAGGLIRECHRLADGAMTGTASPAGGPFSIHAAETPEEVEVVRDGRGPLRDFLVAAGVDPRHLAPKGIGSIAYLDRLDALPGALLVHAGEIDAGDIEAMGEEEAAVAFCPRSHAGFGRPRHPLRELLRGGVAVVLGTDSAASAGRLSMAAEMREVRLRYPQVPAATIFDLATGLAARNRARHGGPLDWLSDLTARIDPGRPADLAAAELPGDPRDPLEAFLREEAPNALTMVAGKIIFRKN